MPPARSSLWMENALYSASVKVLEHSEGVLEVPQLSEMIHMLLLQQRTDAGGPCQVLGDVGAPVLRVRDDDT